MIENSLRWYSPLQVDVIQDSTIVILIFLQFETNFSINKMTNLVCFQMLNSTVLISYYMKSAGLVGQILQLYL